MLKLLWSILSAPIKQLQAEARLAKAIGPQPKLTPEQQEAAEAVGRAGRACWEAQGGSSALQDHAVQRFNDAFAKYQKLMEGP